MSAAKQTPEFMRALDSYEPRTPFSNVPAPTSSNDERIMLYRPKDAQGEPWGFYRPGFNGPGQPFAWPLPDDWESAVFVRVA